MKSLLSFSLALVLILLHKLQLLMESKSTTSEFLLINDCLKGVRKRQKEFYELYSPKLFAISLSYAKDRCLAEDILQDAFIKIFNNLDKFRGEGSFEGWLRRITVHSAIEVLRACKKNLFISLEEDFCFTCNSPSPLETLFEKDLVKVADSLSKGYRDVFNLYAIEGYSHKEIAKKFKITESTSKSQYHRAKTALREIIQEMP